jgi:hypothetical protein
VNHPSPDVGEVQWTIDEEKLLRAKVAEYGNYDRVSGDFLPTESIFPPRITPEN